MLDADDDWSLGEIRTQSDSERHCSVWLKNGCGARVSLERSQLPVSHLCHSGGQPFSDMTGCIFGREIMSI